MVKHVLAAAAWALLARLRCRALSDESERMDEMYVEEQRSAAELHTTGGIGSLHSANLLDFFPFVVCRGSPIHVRVFPFFLCVVCMLRQRLLSVRAGIQVQLSICQRMSTDTNKIYIYVAIRSLCVY